MRKPKNNRGALKSLTKELLHSLYWEQNLSQWQIANRYGATQGAVLYWFRKYGIKARSHDDSLLLLGKSGRFSGDKNPRWSGGRIRHQGYILLSIPGHHRADHRGYVREHIFVWEKANGRKLPAGWEVHHVNGIKDDNRPQNLHAMRSTEHKLVLATLRRYIAKMEREMGGLRDELARIKQAGAQQ